MRRTPRSPTRGGVRHRHHARPRLSAAADVLLAQTGGCASSYRRRSGARRARGVRAHLHTQRRRRRPPQLPSPPPALFGPASSSLRCSTCSARALHPQQGKWRLLSRYPTLSGQITSAMAAAEERGLGLLYHGCNAAAPRPHPRPPLALTLVLTLTLTLALALALALTLTLTLTLALTLTSQVHAQCRSLPVRASEAAVRPFNRPRPRPRPPLHTDPNTNTSRYAR